MFCLRDQKIDFMLAHQPHTHTLAQTRKCMQMPQRFKFQSGCGTVSDSARQRRTRGESIPHRHPLATWYMTRKNDPKDHPNHNPISRCVVFSSATAPHNPLISLREILSSFADRNFSLACQLAFVTLGRSCSRQSFGKTFRRSFRE